MKNFVVQKHLEFSIAKADTSMPEFRSFRFYLLDQQPQNFPGKPFSPFSTSSRQIRCKESVSTRVANDDDDDDDDVLRKTTHRCRSTSEWDMARDSGFWALLPPPHQKLNVMELLFIMSAKDGTAGCWCSNVNMSCKFWTIVKSRSNGGAAVWGLGFPGSCAIFVVTMHLIWTVWRGLDKSL